MYSLKRKLLIISLASGVALCTACTDEMGSDVQAPAMEGTIEVTEGLPDRDIRIPEYLWGETEERLRGEDTGGEGPGQEESDKDNVFHLSGGEQAGMARQVAEQIEDSISQVLADKEHYPHIIGISVDPECTEFNVTFSGRELSLYENVLPMSLCIVGDRFQLYQGGQEDGLMTVVNYIDADSGEVFDTISSKDMT